MANNHPSQSERDRITGYFLPENVRERERLSRETLDQGGNQYGESRRKAGSVSAL